MGAVLVAWVVVASVVAGSAIAPPLDRVELSPLEAGPRAGVAGRADLVDAHEQGVAVAVECHGLHELGVPGGVALAPVLLPAAGPERHPAPGEGAVQRLVVHPPDHEH